VKRIEWNELKNTKLKLERGIGFESILTSLHEGGLLDKIDHPNQKGYPNQKVLVVCVENYVFLVPYVEDDEKIFLKTIYPSRKATKKYLKGE
jgi:hypothetical protein